MSQSNINDLDKALSCIDWGQVVANGGPPCFHIESGKFCLRADRWPGHGVDHAYVPLSDLVAEFQQRIAGEREVRIGELAEYMRNMTVWTTRALRAEQRIAKLERERDGLATALKTTDDRDSPRNSYEQSTHRF